METLQSRWTPTTKITITSGQPSGKQPTSVCLHGKRTSKYINPQPDCLVQSNGFITSTWSSIWIWPWSTTGCTDIVSEARSKCDTSTSRTLVELSAFTTFGKCIEVMAQHYSKDEAIGAAMDECYKERGKHGKTVNILLVDYAIDSASYENLAVSGWSSQYHEWEKHQKV